MIDADLLPETPNPLFSRPKQKKGRNKPYFLHKKQNNNLPNKTSWDQQSLRTKSMVNTLSD